MDPIEMAKKFSWVPPGVMARVEPLLKKIPSVRKQIDAEMDKVVGELSHTLKPYRDTTATYARLPEKGRPREDVLADMRALKAKEEAKWRDGFVSGAVYHGDASHIEFMNEVYGINSQTNPLHADLWPSIAKYEAEIIAMTAAMLNGDKAGPEVCGSVTSGGTESILMAMKAYRDWGRAVKGIRRPNIVVPATAHAAFDKAAKYFGIKMIHVPFGADGRADVEAARRAVNWNTVAMVGSAVTFPHGAIDPIEELSEIARARGIGFHVDSCLGGFILPWAERLGHKVPTFDFRLPGVTSMSCDTHKYGYAAKGTSVVLYRNHELRHHQFYTVTDWPGGLYLSPTITGSRPGALVAQAWASLTSIGEEGYLAATKKILDAAATIKAGIAAIPELRVLGEPLWVIALASEKIDIYRVMEEMTKRGWNLNGLHRPPSVHLCVTLRQTEPGVAERFVEHLRESVDHIKATPQEKGGMAPVYGMAGTLPVRGVISDILKRYLDELYRV